MSGSTSESRGLPPPKDVTADLRALVGLRSRTSARERSLPGLDALLAPEDLVDLDTRYLARQGLIDNAIEAMIDHGHQAAATHLLSVGPLRWQPLTRRGSAAASVFGLGWDGYRRKRESTGTSLLEETLAALTTAIVQLSPVDTVAAPTREPGTEPDPEPKDDLGGKANVEDADIYITELQPVDDADLLTDDQPRPRRSRAALGLIILVVVLTVAGIAAAWPKRKSDPPLRAGSRELCGTLNFEPGDGPNDPALNRWRQPFREASRRFGTDNFVCGSKMSAKTVASTGESFIYQEFSTSFSSPTTILAGSTSVPGHVIWLDDREWTALRHDNDANPERTLGVPQQRIDLPQPQLAVQFSHGITYRESPNAPVAILAGSFYEFWKSKGGFNGVLGAPLTSASDLGLQEGRSQPFAKARLTRPYKRGSGFAIKRYTPAESQLGDATETLVNVEFKTSWWIDSKGVRHWIVNECSYRTLEVTRNAPSVGRSSVALQDLPIGEEIAIC